MVKPEYEKATSYYRCCSRLPAVSAAEDERDATQIVRDAIDHWRGLSSYTEMTMVIHRPDWERSMTMQAWTKGDEQSLVRIMEPKKDRGNGTLTDENSMWTFSPKINRSSRCRRR